MSNPKKPKSAVSAAQFAALRTRVKKLENRTQELEETLEGLTAPSAPRTDPPGGQDMSETEKRLKELEDIKGEGRLSRFRGFVKRNPVFWTVGCLMAGYLIGCLVCDFSVFGGY